MKIMTGNPYVSLDMRVIFSMASAVYYECVRYIFNQHLGKYMYHNRLWFGRYPVLLEFGRYIWQMILLKCHVDQLIEEQWTH